MDHAQRVLVDDAVTGADEAGDGAHLAIAAAAATLLLTDSMETSAVAAELHVEPALDAAASASSGDAETFAEQPASSPTARVVAATKERFRMSARSE